jgi:hypothetical protein
MRRSTKVGFDFADDSFSTFDYRGELEMSVPGTFKTRLGCHKQINPED